MNIGIIGFGLMGQNRARALFKSRHRLKSVYDVNIENATSLLALANYEIVDRVEDLINDPALHAVIISVPHLYIYDYAIKVLEARKHLLCEKPLGITSAQSYEILQLANKKNVRLAVGFNYRFYPGIQYAAELINCGQIGNILQVRCVLGHAGRPGYEYEWKTKKDICGGGALLDPGIHIIDLIRFLVGEIESGTAYLTNAYYPIDVEDNAFVVLKTTGGTSIQAHFSITQWKNKFSLDILGDQGYISLQGRGGYYGNQVLKCGKRWGWLLVPPSEEIVREYTSEDNSFAAELSEFLDWVEGVPSYFLAHGEDGYRANKIINKLYNSARMALKKL